MEVIEAIEKCKENISLVTIEATVDTGFEHIAVEESKQLFGTSIFVNKKRGRIYFNIPFMEFEKVWSMRSVDNLFLIGPIFTNLQFCKKTVKNEENPCKDQDLNIIENIVGAYDWTKWLNVWKLFVGYKGVLYPTREEYSNAKLMKLHITDNQANKLNEGPDVLRFRATCSRSGTHSFGSMDAASVFGGKLQDLFQWVVDLSNFNLEVVLNIIDNQGYVSFGITKQSMHRRNISHFGPTTLRATVAYCLLFVAEIKPGDIVVDPLCGGGSISIEGSLGFPGTYHLCGDLSKSMVSRSLNNVEDLYALKRNGIEPDIFKWNATNLPLRTASVDAFVTDLPFGKRSGLKRNNKPLYHKVLIELARVVRPDVGRAVLLTYDKRSFEIVFPETQMLWKLKNKFGVNHGGLNATVFHLLRTSKSWIK